MSIKKSNLSERELNSLERKRKEKNSYKKFEQFKNNYVNITPAQAYQELRDQGKVPVILDHKTTVWVNAEKCYKNEQGLWIKK